jgi:hypothetical protein
MDDEQKPSRAPPRRAKKDPNEVPLFLQKSYQMIDTAPADIAGWTETGDSFVVKEMEPFCDL